MGVGAGRNRRCGVELRWSVNRSVAELELPRSMLITSEIPTERCGGCPTSAWNEMIEWLKAYVLIVKVVAFL